METQKQPPNQVKRATIPQTKSVTRQGNIAQAPTARIARRGFPVLTVALIAVSVACLGASGYFGYKIYVRKYGKEKPEKIEIKVDRTKEFYAPQLRQILRDCDEALYTMNMIKEMLATAQTALSEEDTKKAIDDLTGAKIKITSALIKLNNIHTAYSNEFKADQLKEGEGLAFLDKVDKIIGNAEQGGLQKDIVTINSILRELK